MKHPEDDEQEDRVISLADAPGEHQAWDKPKFLIYLWALFELLFIYNPFQISSSLRVRILRLFGAEIGDDVIFRPRCRVKFPWKLTVGDRSWIGEGVWMHNQDHIYIGHDVVLSQDAFLTTGSHAHRKDMALITRPIHIHSGVWITSRAIVLGGSDVGKNSIIAPGQVVSGVIPPNLIVKSSPDVIRIERFPREESLDRGHVRSDRLDGCREA